MNGHTIPESDHSAVIVRSRTLRALLDYVQEDEEHDVLLDDNDCPEHIVYVIRELRGVIEKADRLAGRIAPRGEA